MTGSQVLGFRWGGPKTVVRVCMCSHELLQLSITSRGASLILFFLFGLVTSFSRRLSDSGFNHLGLVRLSASVSSEEEIGTRPTRNRDWRPAVTSLKYAGSIRTAMLRPFRVYPEIGIRLSTSAGSSAL